eukprot:7389639-Prymnesium_polylepis.1
MDNSARTKPVYIESIDLVHKVPARKAWKKLLRQSVGHDDFWMNTTDMCTSSARRSESRLPQSGLQPSCRLVGQALSLHQRTPV